MMISPAGIGMGDRSSRQHEPGGGQHEDGSFQDRDCASLLRRTGGVEIDSHSKIFEIFLLPRQKPYLKAMIGISMRQSRASRRRVAGAIADGYGTLTEMILISCFGLLFDLDGVLVDSTPAVARVWTRWALARGFEPAEVVRKAHGRPSLATIRDFLPHADHEAENRKLERSEIEDVEGVVPLPGSQELLAQLPQGRWAIVTSCTRALAEVRIRVAGLPFPSRVVTSSDITHGKPHPEPYCKGASMLGVEPSECLVFEDAPAGIRAGKAAGCRVVAVRTLSPESELQAAGADWIVDSCASVTLSDTISPGKRLMLSLDGGVKSGITV